jgi:DNA-directed RNA polymerase subunit L
MNEEVNPNEELKRENEELKQKYEESEETNKALSQQKNLLKRELFISKHQFEEQKALVLSSKKEIKQLKIDKHKLQINDLILTADYEVLLEENNETIQEKNNLEEKYEKIVKDNDEIKDKCNKMLEDSKQVKEENKTLMNFIRLKLNQQ